MQATSLVYDVMSDAEDVHLAICARHARRPRLRLARYAYTYITLLLLSVESRMPHVSLSVVLNSMTLQEASEELFCF